MAAGVPQVRGRRMQMRRLPQAIALIALTSLMLAQDQVPASPDPNQPDGAYEPGRAVARISVLNGDVSVRRGDSGDVVAGAFKAAGVGGDRVVATFLPRAA